MQGHTTYTAQNVLQFILKRVEPCGFHSLAAGACSKHKRYDPNHGVDFGILDLEFPLQPKLKGESMREMWSSIDRWESLEAWRRHTDWPGGGGDTQTDHAGGTRRGGGGGNTRTDHAGGTRRGGGGDTQTDHARGMRRGGGGGGGGIRGARGGGGGVRRGRGPHAKDNISCFNKWNLAASWRLCVGLGLGDLTLTS